VRDPRIVISGAVEGDVDEAVVARLVFEVGGALGAVHGKNGKAQLRQHVAAYNKAACFSPWVVLVDLNGDAECAPLLQEEWLPHPAPRMCFRIAVRAIEAWLLADTHNLSQFLGVTRSAFPPGPELERDPKQKIVSLSANSRRRDVREDMVPRPGSGRKVGPAYTSRLIEFVESHWRPDEAAKRSDSLRRCVERLRELVASA
jgi:hypothetical protein